MLSEYIRDHLRTITVTAAVLLFAIVAYSVFTLISHSGKVAVTVSIVPSDAHTTLNGQSVSSGTIYLKAGTYTIVSSKSGFSNFKKTQYIGDNQGSVIVSLVAQSDAAVKWAQDNQQAYLNNESLGGVAAATQGAAVRDSNPIVNDLPYDNQIYTIGYITDPSDPSGNSIIITIDAPEGYRNAAIQQIKSFGYDPQDYKYKFYNYTDPFSL